MSLLGAMPELDDLDAHQPVEHGTLTRCEVDGQMWPCSTVETGKALAQLVNHVAEVEMIDVGWSIAARTPEQLDPRPINGMVVGYDDDEEAGRTYRVLRWKHGAPSLRTIRARDLDPRALSMPNSSYIKDAYRRLALHVGKQSGSADGTEVRDLAYALQLAQAVA